MDWQQTLAQYLAENVSVSQLRFTCSNSTIVTLKKDVKYAQS